MFRWIISLYISMLPVIIGASLNMAFCKSPLFKQLNRPLDGNRTFSDQEPIFGRNKTYKGFIGMMVITALCQGLWGALLAYLPLAESLNLYYRNQSNRLSYNLLLGGLLGFAYVLFELPNSFLKRRLQILPGKHARSDWFWPFFVLDQIDSLIGIVFFSCLVTRISWPEALGIIGLGFFTHIFVNQCLYRFHLRANPY
ncbi:CDP-archaeol synthase [Ignavigranum ruoffiae]|uniref:CDP-archaeol synthase n=1 Tax=Ignavigranum ruoffiae TaxID=89093 RepID=UPI00206EF505|nr:CDP-archaeol synthase [Ignavigranum ruoffiae]UPQ86247.1 CDP-archaeol synthase [Ignavigranum ruoffiae]